MTREELIEVLRARSPSKFLEEQLFDRIPHAFGTDRAQYSYWKRVLSAKLEVDPACVMLVGSAALGFSLNPAKNLKPFDAQSDVDVAVVSGFHFTIAWRYLRTNNVRRLRVDERTRIAWDMHEKRYIYWGTIATDRLLGVLPFGLTWLSATSQMSALDPTRG